MSDINREAEQVTPVIPGIIPVGNAPPGISGIKFNDLNRNGVRDANEPGIGNVRIFIDLNNNGVLETNETSVLTDASGNFAFPNLRPGNYVVREIPPAGLGPTTPNPLLVTVGTTDARIFFGNAAGSSIVGCKFLDLNSNAFRDGDEPGIGGATIYIDSNNNNQLDVGELRTVTDRWGHYRFDGLSSGLYRIREVRTNGLTGTGTPPAFGPDFPQTTPPAPFGVPNLDVNLGPNEVWGCADIGNAPTYTITVRKFQDNNRNGIQDAGEPPLPNVPFILDLNNNGRQDPNEPLQRSRADGLVFFTNLPAGNYPVLEIFPPGDPGNAQFPVATGPNPVVVTAPGPSAIQSVLPPQFTVIPAFVPSTAPAPPITFTRPPSTGGAAGTEVGNSRPNITIFKFNDSNANGRSDQGEVGIPGVQFFLDLNGNGTADAGEPTTSTNAQGQAAFTRLLPGNYTVREVVPPGFSPTTAPVVNVAVSDLDANIQFGNAPNGRITGCKFDDLNNNGFKDGNERGIQGVTIFIDVNGNGNLDQGERSTVSDKDGLWAFPGLPPGRYSIREVTPPGSFQTTPKLDILLGPGQEWSCAQIGNGGFYTLKVTKFEDINRNGFRDTNEPVIPNTPFILDFNRNQRQDAGEPLVSTNASGEAFFTNLAPGRYSVFELQPPGLRIGTTPNPYEDVVPGPNAVRQTIAPGTTATPTPTTTPTPTATPTPTGTGTTPVTPGVISPTLTTPTPSPSPTQPRSDVGEGDLLTDYKGDSNVPNDTLIVGSQASVSRVANLPGLGNLTETKLDPKEDSLLMNPGMFEDKLKLFQGV